ncbi:MULTISPECIES: TraB/GumN family protein [Gammaproteobacteria]|uniref:TraB/GumN family protein n=1 Tax=Gammaproteobacteria TaxID=1236 RepID=UPI000DD08506|nr:MULTISPECIES: TraB/GumN family protein [Gammaproteobacteria]RTE86869.1 TraB/GumN family protein [Aliidiomarina sp. B3213]TCZ93342.1 TraB/GumN family protein [Lysobacter sp. N42]
MKRLKLKVFTAVWLLLAAWLPTTLQAELLYEVTWDNKTVWLLGTIHLVSNEETRLSDTAQSALQESRFVWLEMTPQELSRSSTLLFEQGVRSEPYLQEQLDPEQWAKLAAVTSRLGLATSVVGRMEPWLLEYVVLVLTLRKEGFDEQLGIDMQLIRAAEALEKPLRGLEDAEDQVSVLMDARDEMPLIEHIELILGDSESAVQDMRSLEAMWERGELAELLTSATAEMSERTKHVLLVERNQKWFRQIRQEIAADDTVFVGVGAAHLGGEQGLLDLFERAGAEITRH